MEKAAFTHFAQGDDAARDIEYLFHFFQFFAAVFLVFSMMSLNCSFIKFIRDGWSRVLQVL
jgi:hypothetical protein